MKNQGLGDAGPSHLKFSLVVSQGAAPIKKLLESVAVPAVPHGDSKVVTAPLTVLRATPLGTYLVVACVDSLNEVAESSNENNCWTSVAPLQVIAE